MSGWFGTSNRDTNNPLSGIAAGHAARRNMQKQRYNPLGTTVDQIAEKSISPSSEYRGFKLQSTFNAVLNKWVTKASMGLTFLNAAGRSKGESVNAVKSKIDTSLGIVEKQTAIFTDASASITDATVPVTDPGEVARFNRLKAQEEAARMFTPVTMPKDFSTGRYTVRAAYNSMSRKYTVSVIEGTVVKEVATFTQDQGAAAVVKYQQLKSLATKKFIYDAQKPQSVQKTNYNIDLQVTTAAAGLSGFLNGIMGMFGLGLTADQIAEQNRVGPKPDFHAASSASVTTDYTSASNRPEVSGKWSEMPAKSFKVITSRKDGTVVKESGSTSDYLKAVDMFQAEVATIENTPDFYDQDAPPVLEVPTNNGNGGDITSSPDKRPPEPTVLSSGVVQYPMGYIYQPPAGLGPSTGDAENGYKGYILRAIFYGDTRSTGRHSLMVIEVRNAKQRLEDHPRNSTRLYAGSTVFQTFVADFASGVKVRSLEVAAKAWVDANPLIQNDGPGNTGYRDPIIAQAAAKLAKQEAAAAKAAKVAQANEAARFKRMKEQEVATAAAAKAAADQAAAEALAAKDFLRQEAAQTAAKIEADKMLVAQQQASQAAAVEAQAKADAQTFLQQEQAAATAEALAVQRDAAEKASATQFLQDDGWKQTGSENYNDMVMTTEDTSKKTLAWDNKTGPGAEYVPMNYQDNPYVVQQATADVTPVASATHSHLGLALVGLAGLAYVVNRK